MRFSFFVTSEGRKDGFSPVDGTPVIKGFCSVKVCTEEGEWEAEVACDQHSAQPNRAQLAEGLEKLAAAVRGS